MSFTHEIDTTNLGPIDKFWVKTNGMGHLLSKEVTRNETVNIVGAGNKFTSLETDHDAVQYILIFVLLTVIIVGGVRAILKWKHKMELGYRAATTSEELREVQSRK